MDCFPVCRTCTGLCRRKPVKARGKTAPIPRKKGKTLLICGHTVPADEITLKVLGDGLGAQPFCERCGDFVPVKKVRKKPATIRQTDWLDLPPF